MLKVHGVLLPWPVARIRDLTRRGWLPRVHLQRIRDPRHNILDLRLPQAHVCHQLALGIHPAVLPVLLSFTVGILVVPSCVFTDGTQVPFEFMPVQDGGGEERLILV
jgi:hypothetical protein